jgi:hypothetical protein
VTHCHCPVCANVPTPEFDHAKPLQLGGYSLRGQVQTIIEQLPDAAKTFSTALARLRTDPDGNIQKMQSAAAEVEKATAPAVGGPLIPKQSATHVVIDQPGFKLGNVLLSGSMGALGFLGRLSLDRPRKCRGLGCRLRTAARHPLPRPWRHRRRHRNGCVHPVRVLSDGVSGRWSVTGDRHRRGDFRHDVDDGSDREDQCGENG